MIVFLQLFRIIINIVPCTLMAFRILKYKIIKVVRYFFTGLNFIVLRGDGKIAKSVKKRGSTIFGDVQIGAGSKIVRGVFMETNSQIIIGKYTSINGPNTDLVSAINKIRVGNFCSIARNVSIQEFNHNFDTITSYHIQKNIFGKDSKLDICSNGDVVIGNDVWIGTQCIILSNAKIGNGAIIAANSVVNGEIPPYAIAAGSPAKVIKYRFDSDTIKLLEETKWWDWSVDRIKRNPSLFQGILNKEKFTSIID